MYSRHSLELFDEWCQNHGEILYSHHSLELGYCQDDGEILYSGHSLASVVEQAMRTFQNSKTLAGNMSMFWQVVLESVMTNFSKFKSFGGKYLYVVSLALGNSRSLRPYVQINLLFRKFLRGVLSKYSQSVTLARRSFVIIGDVNFNFCNSVVTSMS